MAWVSEILRLRLRMTPIILRVTERYGGLVIFGHRELPLDGRQAIQ